MEDRFSICFGQAKSKRVTRQTFKFENLHIWKISLDLQDLVYGLADQLPDYEKYNLRSQITRAVTSIGLNIAEGSTSTTDKDQANFIRIAIRSLIEVIACLIMIERRSYCDDEQLGETFALSTQLFAKLQAFKRSMK